MKSEVQAVLVKHTAIKQLSIKQLKRLLFKLSAVNSTGALKSEEEITDEIRGQTRSISRNTFMQTMRRLGFTNADGRILSRTYSSLDLELTDNVNAMKCLEFFQQLKQQHFKPKRRINIRF